MVDKNGNPINTKRILKSELLEYIELLEQELENERQARHEDLDMYSRMEDEYKDEIKGLNNEILKLRGKVMSQDITMASYKDKAGIPILIEGEEKDLYRGEQKDYLLNIIKQRIAGMSKYTRGYDILKSIIDANPEVGTRCRMQEAIATSLKNFSRFNQEVRDGLESAGMVDNGNTTAHYNFNLCGDNRYRVSISKTPSDNRAGYNTISDINRICF